jgi:hypothetical protein
MRGHSSSAREEWSALFEFNAFPRVFSLSGFILTTKKKQKQVPHPHAPKAGG